VVTNEDVGIAENHIDYFNSPKSALLGGKANYFLPFLQSNYNLVAADPQSNKYYNYPYAYSASPTYGDCGKKSTCKK
jgi:hypothetical protein